MSNPIFRTLENGSGEAFSLAKKIEGDAPSTDNGSMAFGFVDSSGNLVLPALNPDGTLPVAVDSGTPIRARATDGTGSTSLIDLSGALVTAALTKVYTKMSMKVSSRRDTLFQLIYVDDSAGSPTETVLIDTVVGSGQYTDLAYLLTDFVDTTGGTGVQEFKVKYQNFSNADAVWASLSVNEVA